MQVIQRLWPTYFADLAPEYLPDHLSKKKPAPSDGRSELFLYVKMGLVFRPEVQDGAVILVNNSSGCVANDIWFCTLW